MINLDFTKILKGFALTYAELSVDDQGEIEPSLKEWEGTNAKPYKEFY